MKKYWIITKNTWNEILVYRLNFIMWRVRVVLQLLTLYFFWLAVTPQNTKIFGYSQQLIITYIIGTFLVGAITLSSRTSEIGENINNGDLSIFLIRPINYFFYWFSRDLGDKAMNITFSLTELTLIFLVLHPPLFLQTNFSYLVLSLVSILLAIILFFLIGALIGFIGFWSPEVWAPRFIFYVLLNFFAGMIFPLDILPKTIFSVFQLLPFPYLIYFPIKIYLGQITTFEISKGLSISIVWIFIMFFIVRYVWMKGLKAYTAQGR